MSVNTPNDRGTTPSFLPWPTFAAAFAFLFAMFAFGPTTARAETDSGQPGAKTRVRVASPDYFHELDEDRLRDAAEEAQKLWDAILEVDASGGKLEYDDTIIERMRSFYHHGAATKPDPAEDLVTREFRREVVVAILWDVFLIQVHNERADRISLKTPGQDQVQNGLDAGSAKLFRDFLLELLPTALDDLSFLQRARLYRLAGLVLPSEGETAVKILQALASRLVPEDEELLLVQYAVDEIRSQ